MARACVQGRAVIIDLLAHFGRPRKMVGYEDLMMVMEKDKVVVEQGDFVCFRTGFDQVLLEFDREPDESVHDICAVLDGRDAAAAMGDGLRRRRADLRQLRGRECAFAAVRRACRPLRVAAAARALPVQARGLPGRNLAHGRPPYSLRADKRDRFLLAAAVAAARRRGFSGGPGRTVGTWSSSRDPW